MGDKNFPERFADDIVNGHEEVLSEDVMQSLKDSGYDIVSFRNIEGNVEFVLNEKAIVEAAPPKEKKNAEAEKGPRGDDTAYDRTVNSIKKKLAQIKAEGNPVYRDAKEDFDNTLERRFPADGEQLKALKEIDELLDGQLGWEGVADNAIVEAEVTKTKDKAYKWGVSYTEIKGTGRTTGLKLFPRLKDAKDFSEGKYGYITRIGEKKRLSIHFLVGLNLQRKSH